MKKQSSSKLIFHSLEASRRSDWLKARSLKLSSFIRLTLLIRSQLNSVHVFKQSYWLGLGTDLGTWVEKLTKPVSERGLRIVICPGRSLVQDAGVLLTKIVLVKKVSVPVPGSGSSSPRRGSLAGIVGGFPHSPTTTAPINFGQFDKPTNKPPPVVTKQIVILDASTHDLGNSSINPKIIVGQVTPKLLPIEFKYDFCGSTSEANDVLVRDYPLHEELKNDAIIAITDVGAYAMSVGGNYASRNRPAEVLVCNLWLSFFSGYRAPTFPVACLSVTKL